jgi:hypothetical protein
MAIQNIKWPVRIAERLGWQRIHTGCGGVGWLQSGDKDGECALDRKEKKQNGGLLTGSRRSDLRR